MASLVAGIFVFGGMYIFFKMLDEYGWNNNNAHDVDHGKMFHDSVNISKSELKKRYKSGYYNKKK